MKKQIIFFIALLLSVQVFSQKAPANFEQKRSILKVNLTSPIIKNYALQYEHVLSKVVSVGLSTRFMPTSTLPFKKMIEKNLVVEDDEAVSNALSLATFSNFAITPEVRFYLGKKGYGRGFYIAPYYRYANYEAHEVKYDYKDNGDVTEVKLKGNLSSHTGGLLFGAQWMLSNTIGLDWWILGPNIGAGNGSLDGKTNKPISAEDQAELKKSLEEDLDIPFTKKTIYVDANGAKVTMKGPWGGLRSGILLTFRF